MPGEPPLAVEVKLRDGTPMIVRPVLPTDKNRLREGFRRLSVQSRHRRFMATFSELSEAQLRYLTELDYAEHMAWIAVDPADPQEVAVGVARYVRLADEPAVAEAAVVVGDPYQGRGCGTILLGLLGLSASRNGVKWFRSYVQGENHPIVQMLADLGGSVSLEEPGLLRIDCAIPDNPEGLPDTPTGRVFKAVAKQVLPPFPLEYPSLRRAVARVSAGESA